MFFHLESLSRGLSILSTSGTHKTVYFKDFWSTEMLGTLTDWGRKIMAAVHTTGQWTVHAHQYQQALTSMIITRWYEIDLQPGDACPEEDVIETSVALLFPSGGFPLLTLETIKEEHEWWMGCEDAMAEVGETAVS
jgi:hypothetical protein